MLAYDPKLQKIVGLMPRSIGEPVMQTWVWDGHAWAQMHPATELPGPRYGQIAYDAVHGVIVSYGGSWNCTGPMQCKEDPDTWTFDGNTWTRHPGTSVGPGGRSFSATATDPSTGSVLTFGGGYAARFDVLADTWSWDGNAWNQLHPNVSPWARKGGVAVSDSVDKSILLYGGAWNTQNSLSSFYDLWRWKNGEWTLVQPTTTNAPADQAKLILQVASSGPGLLPACSEASGACTKVRGEPLMGYYAAYVVFDLIPPQGQNAQCVSYTYRDQPVGPWSLVGVMCGASGGRMPQLGASASVNVSGCANVRTFPQIGEVVSCLANGTQVTVDDGPISVQGTLWWHLAGRGWMAHQLLIA
jgi:hypothetical protein